MRSDVQNTDLALTLRESLTFVNGILWEEVEKDKDKEAEKDKKEEERLQ